MDKARIALDEFMTHKDMSWLREHLREAKAIVIIPEYWQGGFIGGGAGGAGILLARDEKTGEWSQPVFYTLAGGHVGLLIGGEKSAVIMIVRSKRGLLAFYKTDFKVGGDASAAAGPKGIGVKETVGADIVSFSRSRGLYAGISFEGAVVKSDSNAIRDYYGKDVTARDIIVNRAVSNPGSAELRDELRKTTAEEPVAQSPNGRNLSF